MLFLAILAPVAGLAAAPGTAQAGVSWVVRGHGFGHGVGMSQYGAYGYAKHGKDYRFILGHYYRGTKLGTLQGPRIVRVLVGISAGDIGFSGATGACGKRLDSGREYEAHRSGARVKLRTAQGGRPLADCGRKLRAAGGGRIEIAGIGTYRGALEVVPTDSDAASLNAVNAVPVDQYVKGVIPNESPASWPQAALRAQAVAARSYALTVQVSGNGFDLYDDTSSQVYEGLASETAATNQAAEATRGQVLTYGGEIAEAYFSACSGGHTESVQNVFFGSPVPYLVGVEDPYDYYCPLHTWTLRFSERGDQRQAGLLPGRAARKRAGDQARLLAADRLGAPPRQRRRDQDPRRPARLRARRLRPLAHLPQARRRQTGRPGRAGGGAGTEGGGAAPDRAARRAGAPVD